VSLLIILSFFSPCPLGFLSTFFFVSLLFLTGLRTLDSVEVECISVGVAMSLKDAHMRIFNKGTLRSVRLVSLIGLGWLLLLGLQDPESLWNFVSFFHPEVVLVETTKY